MGTGRPRFSLGILTVYIALMAVILAPLTGPGWMLEYSLPFALGRCAEMAILLAYRRLSRWLWVIIASKICHAMSQLVVNGGLGSLTTYGVFVPIWMGHFLFVLGLGMGLRDIRHQLADAESRAALPPDTEHTR